MTLEAGSNLGPYRILGPLGSGGMASVYRAHHAELSRYVAIKVLPAHLAEQPGFVDRFQQEARAVASLRHPHILAVFDSGHEGEVYYIVNEFVDGGTLADQLGQPLPDEYVVQMLEPIASALDYAHSRGVLHRDVKPTNILLSHESVPVLADFGLARMMETDSKLTQTGMVIGTPQYMSPEQCMGDEVAAASDQYSLALIAYEMLTGKPAFDATTPAAVIMAQVQNQLAPPRQLNPHLANGVEQALLKALAKSPSARYRTCADFIRALKAGISVPSEVVPKAEPIAAPAASARLPALPLPIVAIAMLIVVLITATGAWVVLRTGSANSAGSTGVHGGAPALARAKGPLIYEARFDGTELSMQPFIMGSAHIDHPGGKAEIVLGGPGGDIGGSFTSVPTDYRYVAEISVTQSTGMANFEWQFVQKFPEVYSAHVFRGTVELQHMSMSVTGPGPSTPGSFGPSPCPPTCTGPSGGPGPTNQPAPPQTEILSQPFPCGDSYTLSAIVDGGHIRFFVNQNPAFDVSAPTITKLGPGYMGFGVHGNSAATIDVTAIRLYKLAGS